MTPLERDELANLQKQSKAVTGRNKFDLFTSHRLFSIACDTTEETQKLYDAITKMLKENMDQDTYAERLELLKVPIQSKSFLD